MRRFLSLLGALAAVAACGAGAGESGSGPILFAAMAATRPSAPAAAAPRRERLPPVMLGIDVLEAEDFAAIRGRRIGLLTHPAGVDRRGMSTIDVLRRAPGVKLVALYAVEHGIYDELPRETPFPDRIDPRTGLRVYSLYNGKTRNFRPTPQQLRSIDTLVIDLQDIGTRSYTFIGAMKSAMEACFENGKAVVVLDRPNPLGGLKVDGPPLDPQWMSDVGRFRVPYVHGLTMGELALMAKDLQPPAGLAVPPSVRKRGRLTVVAMRGWRRSMRWPDTGLAFVPTSPNIQDFAACEGYPMTGLGCILGGFRNSVGGEYIFRGVSHLTARPEAVEKALRALNLPGIRFVRIRAPDPQTGRPVLGLYVEITDYNRWEPTALSFWMMKLACRLEPRNPFGAATEAERRTFLIHVGSTAFFNDLVAKGRDVDIDAWLRRWRAEAKVFQEQSQRYWLYR